MSSDGPVSEICFHSGRTIRQRKEHAFFINYVVDEGEATVAVKLLGWSWSHYYVDVGQWRI